MIRETDGSLESVSRLAYGKARRLQLMLATLVTASPRICQKDLIDATSAPPAAVKQFFTELELLGMLQQLPAEPGIRNIYFRVIDGVGWTWAKDLVRLSTDTEQTETLW